MIVTVILSLSKDLIRYSVILSLSKNLRDISVSLRSAQHDKPTPSQKYLIFDI